MKQPFILVGAGTEVATRVILPACVRIREGQQRWPEHVFALIADGDEVTRTRYQAARIPTDRAAFVPLSVGQVREALAWRQAELGESWRDSWEGLVDRGPDNGARMMPAVGRLMIQAARPAIVQHLEAIRRRLAPKGAKAPEVFIVFSPVSGTSRGSVVDLPRYVRGVFPDAHIHGVVMHPVGLEDMDGAVARLFQANFVEALKLIERETSEQTYRVWLDDAQGWQTVTGRVLDSVFAFDERYGNVRRSHLREPSRTLPGRLEALTERVTDFLTGTVTSDPLYERARGRLVESELHRGELMLDGHRTYVHAIHEVRATLNLEALRRTLVERGLERVSRRLAEGRSHDALAASGAVFEAPEATL
jgi:hypothetical protein